MNIDRAMGFKNMKRFARVGALLVLIASPAILQKAVGQTAPAAPDPHRAMLNTYCATCHNTRLKTGGIAFDAPRPPGRAR